MANCTPPSRALDAANDIVGPGALTAFFATAAITYFTVIYAYISDSLDEDLLNAFDASVIKMAGKILVRLKCKSRAPRQNTDSAGSGHKDGYPGGAKQARKDAISSFLVGLSDQQLVTGLAILVAAVSGQQSLSGYDFSVALGLGWFSCTTHLATIDVLCVRFKRHGVIRDARVAGLVCLMGLLSYALIRTTSITDFTIPVDCPENEAWVNYTDIVTILPVWVDYFTAVRTLYLGPSIGLWDVVVAVSSALWGHKLPTVGNLASIKDEKQSEKVESLVGRSNKHARTRLGLFFYDGSFLATFPDMTYSFCFGIAQIVMYRWQNAPELSEASTEMGFGQITTLLLLLLPFLAIGEAYTCTSAEYGLLVSAYRAIRRGVASKVAEVTAAQVSAEEENLDHEPIADIQHATRACSQTARATTPPDGSVHQSITRPHSSTGGRVTATDGRFWLSH